MSIRVVCPSCDKVYNLDESMEGKKVVCRECKGAIPVGSTSRNGRDHDRGSRDERLTKSPRSNGAVGRSRFDDDDRRRPAERSCDRDDEPRRDRPRRSERRSKENKNLVPILVGVGIGAVALIILVIGVVVLASRNKGDGQPLATQQTSASASNLVGPAGGGEVAPPAGPVPSDMAQSVVQQVKRSTVYLRVTAADGGGSGSGFFAVERGIVITNAHVIGMLKPGSRQPRSVDVVVNSGETDELKLKGTILGVDRTNDLAVLRADGDISRLPPPLPIDSASKLTETQKVYIFGFPFGEKLGKNITVSNSSVSSLRRKDRVLKEVQVNGGMNPGNSGGPVTDARGVVVAVSVAGITGTNINFAIPADFIQQAVDRAKSNPMGPDAFGPGPLARGDDQPPPPTGLGPGGIPPGGIPGPGGLPGMGGPRGPRGPRSPRGPMGPLGPRGPAGRPGMPAGPGNPTGPGIPDGPIGGADLQGDLAKLRGIWESGDVNADGGSATGSLKLHIGSFRRGTSSGRIRVEVSTKQAGRTTTSKLTYNFTLTQRGDQRVLVATLAGSSGIIFTYSFDGDELVVSGKVLSRRISYTLSNVSLRRTAANPTDMPGDDPTK
jgi:S1-C subfamily serine protease